MTQKKPSLEKSKEQALIIEPLLSFVDTILPNIDLEEFKISVEGMRDNLNTYISGSVIFGYDEAKIKKTKGMIKTFQAIIDLLDARQSQIKDGMEIKKLQSSQGEIDQIVKNLMG